MVLQSLLFHVKDPRDAQRLHSIMHMILRIWQTARTRDYSRRRQRGSKVLTHPSRNWIRKDSEQARPTMRFKSDLSAQTVRILSSLKEKSSLPISAWLTMVEIQLCVPYRRAHCVAPDPRWRSKRSMTNRNTLCVPNYVYVINFNIQ